MPPVRIALDRLREVIPQLRPVEGGGASLEVTLARVERPETKVARLVEGDQLYARRIPLDMPPAVTAFLDGVQESREVAWIGSVPLVHGRVAAVVRERIDRRLVTWGDGPRHQTAIYAPWARLSQRDRALVEEAGFHTREVADHQGGNAGAAPNEPHPLRTMQDASNAVKQDREVIERQLADAFCRRDAGILYVDGSLPSAEGVQESSRVVGVIKSHQTLYVSGADLVRVFALEKGERSSAFAVESRHRPTVASWYLRVRDAGGRDPFWGLVRLEIPMREFEHGGADIADECSAWVLAERAPVALPDGRWDTMAYGIRDCEAYLRAVAGM